MYFTYGFQNTYIMLGSAVLIITFISIFTLKNIKKDKVMINKLAVDK